MEPLMNAVQTLLAVFDDAWSHPWEGVLQTLEDLEPAEATWQPPFYRNEECPDRGLPPGSVVWHVDHLRRCKDEYKDRPNDR